MFTFVFNEAVHGHPPQAKISTTEGLKKRGFAQIYLRALPSNAPQRDITSDMMLEHMTPHLRAKYEQAFAAMDNSEGRARANAFLTTLCHMLNNPDEQVEEQPGTRYSYGEKKSAGTPGFPDPKGRERSSDFPASERIESVHFEIERYAGIVNSSAFADVFVWPDDADRMRVAMEKTLYSMVDHDRPPDASVDFRRTPSPQ